MAATTFDRNAWYMITPLTQPTAALTSLLEDSVGSAYLSTTNNSDESMQWQLYPLVNPPSTHLIRCRTRDYGFLGTEFDGGLSINNPGDCNKTGITCSTSPWMRTGADESSVWTLTSWGDESSGSYYLTNAANGTGYHLDEQPNQSWLYMNSNTTAGNPGQQWAFTSVGPIDDATFSTVAHSLVLFQTGSATATPTTSSPAATTTSSQTSSTPSAAQTTHSSGLSTGARAGIGVAAGVIVLALIVWFLVWRSRKNRDQPVPSDSPAHSIADMDARAPRSPGMMSDGMGTQKMDPPYHDSPMLAEAPGHPVMHRTMSEMGSEGWREQEMFELPHMPVEESRSELEA